jgi:metal-sulfur cluster biosynthetic enzyme
MGLNLNSLNEEEIDVLEILKNVYEPATEVGIIDLGLVYSIAIVSNEVIIEMTFTSSDYSMGDSIIHDIEQIISNNYPGFQAKVNVVWSPEWSLEMVSEEGKLALSEL